LKIQQDQRYYTYVLNQLHRWNQPADKHWTPHPFQAEILVKLFSEDVKTIFVQCGRKFGKTEIIIYILWRWALFNPGSACYYFCPNADDAKEIIWDAPDQRGAKRLPDFGPPEFIKSIIKSELRVELKNGSFIKVDGSNNISAIRGYSPSLYVADEYGDFHPDWEGEMEPNRATFDAPAIYIGTPPPRLWIDPETPHHYVRKAKQVQDEMADGLPSFWVKRPSWDNPIPTVQAFLRRTEVAYKRMGKHAEWAREYLAEMVEAGERKVFPNFNAARVEGNTHIMDNSDIISYLNG